MTGPRVLARRFWRQIIWGLFASYLVVGLAAIGVVGLAGALFTARYFGTHVIMPTPKEFRSELVQGLLIGAAAAVITAVGVSLFVSHRIVVPLRQIMDASRRIADGNYDERVPIRDDFEITQLAASF